MNPPKSPSGSRFQVDRRPPSPSGLRFQSTDEPKGPVVVLGVCAMDIKARSKAMREILTRLVELEAGGVDVKIFGDPVILEEDINHWPPVDVLISFFSTDFPLPKALAYTQLPNRTPPISINSLAMQSLLWDRRLVLAILDHIGVPTPKRAEVSRDGGPHVDESLRMRVRTDLGLVLPGQTARDEHGWADVVIPERWKGKMKKDPVPRGKEVILRDDGDAIIIDGHVIEKPFVEKPVDGEDHNVYIYYRGGGGRRLFRKVGNKSSEYDPGLVHPRTIGSYIYEEFINVDNAEDIKVYTVGPNFSHAETRKSPTVDGLVRRNADGKETRFITKLSNEETSYARDVVDAFGQRVCGFDLLRCQDGTRSMVIDVNGWSFVKGNQAYYDKAAEILSQVCQVARERKLTALKPGASVLPLPDASAIGSIYSTLRATVTVLRHADRTPKMKIKFSFPASEPWARPFLCLLRGHREEIILRDPRQLQFILAAAEESSKLPGVTPEILTKLAQLKEALQKKIDLPGTKAQLKPSFEKKKGAKTHDDEPKKEKKKKAAGSDDEDELTETERSQKVENWLRGGPPQPKTLDRGDGFSTLGGTSTSPGSTIDLGDDKPRTPAGNEAMYASHIPEGLEKMQLVVKWGGESTHSSRYQARDLGDAFKKDIMIMNKDVLNNVKIYTSSERRVINTAQIFAHALLGVEGGSSTASNSSQYAGSPSLHPTAIVNGGTAASPPSIAGLPPTSNLLVPDPCPSISHLIVRRDLLDDNNAGKEKMNEAKKQLKVLLRPGESERRPDLAWPKSFKREPVQVVTEVIEQLTELRAIMRRNYENGNVDKIPQTRWCSGDSPWLFRERWEKIFEDWVGVKQEKFDPSRVSELYDSMKYDALHNRAFFFAVFDPRGVGLGSKPGVESADRRLHDLYGLAKALFDLVGPQEYGYDAQAKEEIAVLTSLPLLRKVWGDLNEAMTTGKSLACFYFTKESHITTFVNLLLASGLPLGPVRIPELDYCSHCTIELWEKSAMGGHKDFSVRLSISEGAHSPAVLDSSVDARHSLTVQPRKKLSSHVEYELARQCFSKHFDKGLSFSTTPLEGDAVYLKKAVQDESVLPLNLNRTGEETPRLASSAGSERGHSQHPSGHSDSGW
ncbi:actin cytoskeleton organization and biogenesis-related protein [Kockovaella imperatae]|uniref:Inositol hexakisphosphate and diphosphoinositol-pentakisphosphate kinase n=1 Tax=Kockovaella imperatae TaxID=4999 RepID=A0A1Y1UN69_9TREE|nr:actin cytoskeleton organization and biogenesis-related protein [Kockovaella imperatae]ORX38575.1 actin cytoskeleton organization and biogenesis-related protein [Kockovaella imperatae]